MNTTVTITGPSNGGKTSIAHVIKEALAAKGFIVKVTDNGQPDETVVSSNFGEDREITVKVVQVWREDVGTQEETKHEDA